MSGNLYVMIKLVKARKKVKVIKNRLISLLGAV
jgi:hypothetical protein